MNSDLMVTCSAGNLEVGMSLLLHRVALVCNFLPAAGTRALFHCDDLDPY